MLVIVDYDLGNPGSVANMFRRQAIDAKVSRDPEVIANATRLVLGGVGAFDQGMQNIDRLGLRRVLDQKVLEEKVPIIGFCLGMQLMTKRSDEGSLEGLGWVDAETVHFRTFYEEAAGRLKFPHIGWDYAHPAKEHPLLEGIASPMRFYFVHTYKVVCSRPDDVLLRSIYGDIPFTCAFASGSAVGVQFHPEKSHRYGLKLLSNYAKWSPSDDAVAPRPSRST